MRASILLVLLGLSACGFGEAPGDRGLSNQIAARVERGGGTLVDLDALASFEWTRFCAFGPYTTEDVAEDELGFRWPYAWSRVEDLDDRNYLVFVNGDEVVAAFDHARNLGDFAGLDPACHARDDARFVVRERGQFGSGAPYYVMHAAP